MLLIAGISFFAGFWHNIGGEIIAVFLFQLSYFFEIGNSSRKFVFNRVIRKNVLIFTTPQMDEK